MLGCLLQMRICLYVLLFVLVWLSSNRRTSVFSMCDPHRDRRTVNTSRAGNPESLVFRFSRTCSRFVNLQISNCATVQRKRTEDALCFDCFICQSCHDTHSHRWPTLLQMHRVNLWHKFISWYNTDAKVGRLFAGGESDSSQRLFKLLKQCVFSCSCRNYNCLFTDAKSMKCNMLKHHKISYIVIA